MDSVFCALWLATQSVNILHYSLIHFQLLRASDAKLAKAASKMPFRFAAVTNKESSQLIKQAVPEIHEEGDKVRFGNFKQVKLCLFDLNLSIKAVKNFLVYKCKLNLSLALLYLVDLFINKLKTKFNNLFLQNDFKYK